MDFYNIFFCVGVSLGLILAFYKPSAHIGRIFIAATFGISACYGLFHPVDIVKVGIDILAVGLILWELASKHYKSLSQKQAGIGALVCGAGVIILGVLSPIPLPVYIYGITGLVLLTQGVVLTRQRSPKIS